VSDVRTFVDVTPGNWVAWLGHFGGEQYVDLAQINTRTIETTDLTFLGEWDHEPTGAELQEAVANNG
jgi:hypothetical protein